jgi:hypothetical protein
MSPIREMLFLMSLDHILKITMDFKIDKSKKLYVKTLLFTWLMNPCSLSVKTD